VLYKMRMVTVDANVVRDQTAAVSKSDPTLSQ